VKYLSYGYFTTGYSTAHIFRTLTGQPIPILGSVSGLP
jgi:hypothetical protein